MYGYAYDSRGRLTDVTTDGAPTSHYEYDANGNRLVGPGLTASPVYDAQDRMTSYGSCSYAYKADGSLQAKTCPDGTTMYDYDAFGNLRHVTLPNGTNIDYVIDGQNRRVGKKVNGVLVEGFLYRSQLQPAVWLNGDGSVRATFVYGLHANVPEYMVKGGTTYRLITDQVGSVRLVVDSAGNVAERIDYDEFGNVLADSVPGTQPFRFAGGLRDLHTGLVRFGARDYDSEASRWTTQDEARFDRGTTNMYEYAANDPLNFADADGLKVKARRRVLAPKLGVSRPCWQSRFPGVTCFGDFPTRTNGCRRRKGTYGFDAFFTIVLRREFSVDPSMESEDTPPDTLLQHENRHLADYLNATSDSVINKKIKTEGFLTAESCAAAEKDFVTCLNDYFRRVDARTKRHDRHGY